MPDPPETQRRPVTETLHGVEITDPYRWLEDGDDPAVQDWIDDQNAYADQFLESATAEALEPRFDDLARVTDYGGIDPSGGRYFQQVEAPDEDQPVLYVRDTVDADPRPLVDPNRFEGENPSMDWYAVAPDGDRLAYGYAEGGDEQYDIRVLDVDTGTVEETVPGTGRTNQFGLAWVPDGFYYVRTGGPGGGDQLDKALYFHESGTDPDTDTEITDAFDEHAWIGVDADEDTGTVLVTVMYGTTHAELYRLVPEAEDPLHPLLTGYDATFAPEIHDGTVYIQTNYDAPNSRLLATPVEAVTTGDPLDPDALTEVLPEDDAVLQSVAFGDDRLAAHRLRDASSELTIYDLDGTEHASIDLPQYCTVAALSGTDNAREWFFTVQTFTDPATVCRYTPTEGRTDLDSADVTVEVDLTVTRRFVESTDGTEVPAFLVHRSDLDRDGDNPTIVYGYGGFRISQTPGFDRFRAPFLEAGGIWVQTCLRGGTEYGEPWHEAGMLANKQQVFDDFIAVAEDLVDADYTSPDRLAAYGGSNGGLLVGAAITQRPDLWRAAFCSVPLLDMLRFHEFLLGESWTVEYGSPEDPDAFEWLHAYSPYHNAPETGYPATLFKTALGDTRVHPAHARKMTALLQERNTGPHPVILRTETGTGHGVGKPTSMIVREQAEQWGFLFEELGLDASA
ncbi:MAG: prolyl oligopeptidase family protein [Halobacteriaceae archaeon]